MPKLADYLESIGFKNPVDPEASLFHFTYKTDLNMFEWLEAHPQQLAGFSAYQAAATTLQTDTLKKTICTLFPTSRPSDNDGQKLLVDVGGGRGEILESVCEERPDLQDRVVVQDLPKVVVGRRLVHGIEIMPHNFFTPQPVHGTSAYDMLFYS